MKSLVVEDDELTRLLLQSILSEYGECDIAGNGKEALCMVRETMDTNPYDLICLDIIMPIMDGSVALEEIRKLEKEREGLKYTPLKAIMISSLEDYNTIFRSFNEGQCEAFLSKPVRIDELVEVLEELELIAG